MVGESLVKKKNAIMKAHYPAKKTKRFQKHSLIVDGCEYIAV